VRHGSLFSGGGGFDLAAEWMKWENVFHCEINPFCQRILKYYWPKAISYEDITKTDFTIHRGKIDILTGGFPCQPYSAAGKRKGKEDERHLWPHMLRAIQEIQPRIIVGENVLGLLNWNGGMVFDEVCADLEAAGYFNSITPKGERKVVPVVLPAAGVNAPHQRYRVWFIAHSDINACSTKNAGRNESARREEGLQQQHEIQQSGKSNTLREQVVANTADEGLEGAVRRASERNGFAKSCKENGNASNSNIERQSGQGRPERQSDSTPNGNWKEHRTFDDGRWPTESPVCVRDDEFSSQLDGITLSKWREESIKMAGNAVVPELVYQIFQSIKKTI
jgi:DNA (cytosine-5)-methyltransferase 1